MPAPDQPDSRLESHNASMDQAVAEAGGCAQVHLPTGRTCALQHGHEGTCQFIPADQVADALTQLQPAPEN
jgi:hypothetical protein